MKIKVLKTFLFLVQNQCDFSAHDVLGLPRATMWAHITDLENETGLKLINRRKQNNSLTQDGLAFALYAGQICRLYETGLSKIKSQVEDKSSPGSLIVSTTQAAASSWLLPSIKAFNEQHSNLSINILSNDTLTKRVSQSTDILVRPIDDNDDLIRKWYIGYHHGLYASSEYLERMGEPKSPQDLKEHHLIGYGEHEFTHFEQINWHLRGKGFGLPRLKPILTINSTQAIYKAGSEGIGIISAPVESNFYYKGNLIRILPDINGPLVKTYFSVRSGIPDATQKNVQVFEDYLRKYLKNIGVDVKVQ